MGKTCHISTLPPAPQTKTGSQRQRAARLTMNPNLVGKRGTQQSSKKKGLGRWEKGLRWGGGSFKPPYPPPGGGLEKGLP